MAGPGRRGPAKGTRPRKGNASLTARVRNKQVGVKIMKMRSAGMKFRAIAAKFGVTHPYIIQMVQKYEEILDDEAKKHGRKLRAKALDQFNRLNETVMQQHARLRLRAGLDDHAAQGLALAGPVIDERTGEHVAPEELMDSREVTEELAMLANTWRNIQATINDIFGVKLPEKMEVSGDAGEGLMAAAQKGPATWALLQSMMAHGAATPVANGNRSAP